MTNSISQRIQSNDSVIASGMEWNGWGNKASQMDFRESDTKVQNALLEFPFFLPPFSWTQK